MSIALDRRALYEARRLSSLLSRADLTINELPLLSSAAATDALPIFHNGLTFQIPFSLISSGAASTNIFNVKSFGAIGNGTANDTTPIQAAINAAKAAGGGRVYMPAGTYLINIGLTLGSGVWLQGDGIDVTTIKTATGGPYPFAPTAIVPGVLGPGGMDVVAALSVSDTFMANIAVEDLTIDASGTLSVGGSTTGFQGAGLTFGNVNFSRATRVRVYNSVSYGIQEGWTAFTGSTPKSMRPIVQDCILDSCGRTTGADSIGGGVHTDGRFLGNTFTLCYGNAIDQLLVDYCVIAYNTILSPQTIAVNAGASGRIQSDLGFNNGVIAFNKFIGGTVNTPGVVTDIPAYGVPAGGILLGGGSGTSSHPPQNVVIEGNVFFGSQNGIRCESAAISGGPAGSTCSNIVIKNNVLWQVFGRGPSFDLASGIEVSDADGVIIEGNVIKNWNQNLTTLSYTPNGSGQITAATDTWGVWFRSAGLTSNGVTNSVVRNNTFIITTNNAAQAGIYCEMMNSHDNVFENNAVEMPQTPRYVIRTKPASGAITTLRNNKSVSWTNDTILPVVYVFPLPASTTLATNLSGEDFMLDIAGGTVTAIVINTVNTGVTSGSFLLKAGSSITLTYSVSPTTFVSYPVTV